MSAKIERGEKEDANAVKNIIETTMTMRTYILLFFTHNTLRSFFIILSSRLRFLNW